MTNGNSQERLRAVDQSPDHDDDAGTDGPTCSTERASKPTDQIVADIALAVRDCADCQPIAEALADAILHGATTDDFERILTQKTQELERQRSE